MVTGKGTASVYILTAGHLKLILPTDKWVASNNETKITVHYIYKL